MMYKRKPNRQSSNTGPPVVHSEVRQRVLSARLHRMRGLQNQLGDAQQHVAVSNAKYRKIQTKKSSLFHTVGIVK